MPGFPGRGSDESEGNQVKRTACVTLRLCSALFLCCFFFGCSSEPTMEIEAATTSINSMNGLDAVNYAPDPTKEAMAAWDQAQKYLGSKQYTEARPSLLKAK